MSDQLAETQLRRDSNVILYLPPGPLMQGMRLDCMSSRDGAETDSRKTRGLGSTSTPGQSPQHVLASTLSATVVTLNYRLGKAEGPSVSMNEDLESVLSDSEVTARTPEARTDFQYPTPIHDTLIGFDWIQRNLKPNKLGVFGTHVGGSLSLMLALTEAKSVQAVAALDPICDWPSLDDYCEVEGNTDANAPRQKRLRKGKTVHGCALPDLVPLLEARERFFSSPERCFDAFASPVLFLRSAGRDVPMRFPQYLTGPDYPVPTIENIESVTSVEQHDSPQGSLADQDTSPLLSTNDGASSESSESLSSLPRRRKALSRWPPYGLDYGLSGQRWTGTGHGIGRLQMTLPWVRIFSQGLLARGSENNGDVPPGSTVLSQQGEEMVSAMRRACFWGQEKGVGERRVTMTRVGRDAEDEVGDWLGEALDREMDEP